MKRSVLLVVAGMLAGCLPGCMVGPDYQPPELAMPERFDDATVSREAPPHPTDLAEWWRAFQDPILDELVETALGENLDLASVSARVRQARAYRRIAASELLPGVGANGEYQYTRPFSATSQFGTVLGAAGGAAAEKLLTVNLYQAGFDANWELDLFGGIRRSVEAADADLAATEDALWATQVSLLAEVARAYVDIRALERRLAITAANLESQRDSVILTESRFDSGLTSELDVRQAKSLLATTESEVPDLQRQREQTMHALAVLLRRHPNALDDLLRPTGTIPGGAAPDALAVRIPLGLPSDLLRRRPDVRQAERQVAAATARIGVATAELFPKISLTGFVGLQSISTSDFFTSGSRYFGAGPSLRWRLFEGGRLRAQVDAQDAETQQALFQYEQTVLGSLRDVEDALVAYAKERERRDALANAVTQTSRSVVLSRDLYTHGLGTYLAVLDAQRAEYANEDALAQSDQAVVVALIATYKALGGGWKPPVEVAER